MLFMMMDLHELLCWRSNQNGGLASGPKVFVGPLNEPMAC